MLLFIITKEGISRGNEFFLAFRRVVDYNGGVMEDTSFMIFSTLIAKPGKEDVLRNALFELVPQGRADKGCICYDMHEEIGKPGSFFFYEAWDSKANWDLHMEQAHVKKFGAIAAEVCSSTTMNLCKKSC